MNPHKRQDLNNRWCPVCDRSFRTLDALHKHIARKHEIYKYERKEHVSTTLPTIVPLKELKAAKKFYVGEFVTSFPRL